MKYSLFTAAVLMITGLLLAPVAIAQGNHTGENPVEHGWRFVDQNGDGINDYAPDFDGDGIPNGMDEDYEPAGLGSQYRAGRFIDVDGDGIHDCTMQYQRTHNHRNTRMGYGPGNGLGNQFSGPQNGSGYGPGGDSMHCDGTGPHGFKGTSRRGK